MYMKMWDRYTEDPVFRSMIDMMLHHMMELQLTPTEMREAAMFASIKFEEMKPMRPIIFTKEDIQKGRV